MKEYQGALGPDGLYDSYTGEFPEVRVGLRPLSDAEEQRALELRASCEWPVGEEHLTDPVHQIGGFPMIYNEWDNITCPLCRNAVPFLATICDSAEGQQAPLDPNKSFVDNFGVQMVFHYCGPCRVVTAYHSCD